MHMSTSHANVIQHACMPLTSLGSSRCIFSSVFGGSFFFQGSCRSGGQHVHVCMHGCGTHARSWVETSQHACLGHSAIRPRVCGTIPVSTSMHFKTHVLERPGVGYHMGCMWHIYFKHACFHVMPCDKAPEGQEEKGGQ